MKKRGFTLAEVLITLGIIGVISALVIPQFVGNTYDQANASKLSSIVSDYENIFGHMLLREDEENIFETEFGVAYRDTSTDISAIQSALEQYTKISRIGESLLNVGYTLSYLNNPLMPAAIAAGPDPDPDPIVQAVHIYDINGNDATSSVEVKFALLTPGGATIIFSPVVRLQSPPPYATIYIDVNGGGSPNRFGRDIFAFHMSTDGHLYPYGSLEASRIFSQNDTNVWRTTSSTTYSCNNGNYNGLGCTARLIENNYKMDY